MGYYTNFTITPRLKEDFTEIVDSDVLEILRDRLIEFSQYDEWEWDDQLTMVDVKWYEYPNHMKLLSKEFPYIIFQVDGEGEEPGDIWRRYFLDGKSQKCVTTITFTQFDEDELKEI